MPLYDLPWMYDRIVVPGPCEAFYRSLAQKTAGPVLDLACGTGRLTLPLARDGHEVFGLDASSSMLRAAREKAWENGIHIDYIEGDMRCFDLDRAFSLIVLSCNSMAHLIGEEELSSCLQCVARHLLPDGLFAFDVVNPDLLELICPSPECCSNEKRRYDRWATAYDPINQLQTIRFPFPEGEAGEKVAPMLLRTFFPQEIPLHLKMSGFELLSRFGDFDGNELTGESSNQVYVAQRGGC